MEEQPKNEQSQDNQDRRNHGSEDPKQLSRRRFLRNFGLVAAGAAAGAAALFSGDIFERSKTKGGKKSVLLTQDNQLVEVDSLELKAFEKSPEEKMMLRGRGRDSRPALDMGDRSLKMP